VQASVPRSLTRSRSYLVVVALALAACGGDESPSLVPDGPPVGEPVLPDLVPKAPDVLQMQHLETGAWSIRFTSVLVNVGDGDFILEGTLRGDEWTVEQAVTYSGGGAESVPLDAVMEWGGDGHDHWHVSRVASYRLEPLSEADAAGPGSDGREDTKIGFCFFDSDKELKKGPEKARFSHETCGHEKSRSFLMGLTPGWGDTYTFTLPGQSIDVSDLDDGSYRLWAQADERAWFREATRDNNLTWIDFELSTREDGNRFALIVEIGPQPE
jgi:hypothetical protein